MLGKGIITAGQFAAVCRSEKWCRQPVFKYQGLDLAKAREEAEKQTILRALKACGGNKTQAAQLLGLSRSALYYKMEQYKIGNSLTESFKIVC